MAKKALVIGGSGGVGRAIVKNLADEGMKVRAIGRNTDALDRLKSRVD